jgi:hypothetical protein
LDWRRTGNELLRVLNSKRTGLFVTVDEIHAVDRTEISQLAADVQHLIRDGLPIGLIFAGLPSAVSDTRRSGGGGGFHNSGRLGRCFRYGGNIRGSPRL